MKVRTCLLFACMIVVPGLAMFSHRVPAEFRAATRCALWDPILGWASDWTRSPVGCEVGTAEPGGIVNEAAAYESVVRPDASVVDDDRLVSLEGIPVECRILDDPAGTHVASCRVAMDAAGQLHRVFQAAGQTPDEAVAALATEVEGWRARLAGRTSPSGPPGGSAVY